MDTQPNKSGFTLIELLVVILIISILMAFIVPAVLSSKTSARILDCKNNIRNVGMAIGTYQNAYGRVMQIAGVTGNTATENARLLYMLYDNGTGELPDYMVFVCPLDVVSTTYGDAADESAATEAMTSYMMTANFADSDETWSNKIILADQKDSAWAGSSNHGDADGAVVNGWTTFRIDNKVELYRVQNPDNDSDADGIFTGDGTSAGTDTFIFSD